MSKICLDFDGVLHDPENRAPGYHMGVPVIGAKYGLAHLCASGHKLVICTARTETAHVHKWLKYFKFPNLDVTRVKPQADVYIDDRALRFVNWEQVLGDLQWSMR